MDYHISTALLTMFIILAIWEVFWKGLALWRAARRKEIIWFVAILIINTAGILPIIYLLLSKSEK